MAKPSKEDFRALFEAWRGTKAGVESEYINTAIYMLESPGTQTVDSIKEQLASSKTPLFTDLDKYKKCSSGALLFATLAVKHYLKEISESRISGDEAAHLKDIMESLEGLYISPTVDSSTKIHTLVDATRGWLESDVSNSEMARELIRSLYVMMQINVLSLGDQIGFKKQQQKKLMVLTLTS